MSRNSHFLSQQWNTWRRGIRLYIAFGIILVTLEAWWWASVVYAGSILFASRLEEVYAWLAVSLIGLAVLVGPAYGIWPQLPGKAVMRDARRMFGIGGAWFAGLHAGITYVALFKSTNPLALPASYRQSFALGTLALLILLALAFTSFDGAMRGLGKWWFRLHRLVYIALLLGLAHAFTNGVHATHWPVLLALAFTALVLLSMHIYLAFVRPQRPSAWQVATIISIALALIAIFNYGFSQKLGYNPLEGKAFAHVLKQDHGISAVLHIPPQDSPRAAVPVKLNLVFADAGNTFNLGSCDCQAVVKLHENIVQSVPLQPFTSGSVLNGTATVTFPKAGAYEVAIQGQPRGAAAFPAFQLEYAVKVTAGTPDATGRGESVIIIAAGSLVLLVLFAYTAISNGSRYKGQPPIKPPKNVR